MTSLEDARDVPEALRLADRLERYELSTDYVLATEDAAAMLRKLHAEVEALRGGWIPVTERLPEEGLQVWIAYHWGTENAPKDYEHQGYAIWSNGDWFFDVTESADLYSRQQAVKDGLDAAVVYAWRPLPAPPAQEDGS